MKSLSYQISKLKTSLIDKIKKNAYFYKINQNQLQKESHPHTLKRVTYKEKKTTSKKEHQKEKCSKESHIERGKNTTRKIEHLKENSSTESPQERKERKR